MPDVEWSKEAESFLLAAPVRDAEEILASVERMARTGRGFVRNMLDGSDTLALYLRAHVVYFVVGDSGRIHVLRVSNRA